MGSHSQQVRISNESDLIHANLPGIWTVSTGVAAWPDQIVSASPCDWTQPTGANQPTVSSFTNRPCMLWDGTDYMTVTLPAMNVVTLAFAIRTAGGSRTILSSGGASPADPGSVLIYENGGVLSFEYYRGGTTAKSYTVASGTLLRVVAVFNPAASGSNCWPLLYINGASAGTYGATTSTTGQIAANTWSLGRLNTGGFNWNTGKLGPLLQFGRALTVTEILNVDLYLQAALG